MQLKNFCHVGSDQDIRHLFESLVQELSSVTKTVRIHPVVAEIWPHHYKKNRIFESVLPFFGPAIDLITIVNWSIL